MSREIIIAGNWKMNKTNQETESYIRELSPLVASAKASVYLAVPFTAIESGVRAAKKTNIVIGAQNMHEAVSGAFTGEISGGMLTAAGAEFVILGHSERRQIFAETDQTINKKLVRALLDDLLPILCVGETLEERESDSTFQVIEKQMKEGLKSVSTEDINRIVIAYEPVWAIGTGKTATPSQAQEVHQFIRDLLTDLYGKKVASKISILYGGSVKAENTKDLMEQADIDGALVGGASLEAASFAKIINQC
jgi:triosephosphate isomerase (TIM)